jgi:F420H(2)-dependent quinone reductase
MAVTSSPTRAAPEVPAWVNWIMLGILRSPFHPLLSRTTLVLTVTGRRTGRRYTFPVRYLRTGEHVLVSTDSRWWRNLQGGAHVSLRMRGHEVSGQAEVSTDPEAVEQSILAFLRQMPRDASFYQITLDRAGQPDPVRLKQAVQNRVLITISLDNPAG